MESWTTLTQNNEWKKYNDGMNEGAQGYNPHEKFISIKINTRQLFNKSMTVAEAREMLSKLESSLPKHTDAKKIQGCKDCISLLKNNLQDVA